MEGQLDTAKSWIIENEDSTEIFLGRVIFFEGLLFLHCYASNIFTSNVESVVMLV